MQSFARPLVRRVLCTATPVLRRAASASATRPSLVTVTAASVAAASSLAVAAASSLAECEAVKAPAHCLVAADGMFDANQYQQLYQLLKISLPRSPDDEEINWRLARACKKLADGKSKAEQEPLMREGLKAAEHALKLAPSSGPAHKWYAILLSSVGEFDGTSASIKNSFIVKQHFEKACELSPNDATSRHLLGLWCYEVANLSWMTRKLASTLFAEPPESTFEEAVGHFELAERMDPGFYPKNLLLLAHAYHKMGQIERAQYFLQRCKAAKVRTPEDQETMKLAEAAKIK